MQIDWKPIEELQTLEKGKPHSILMLVRSVYGGTDMILKEVYEIPTDESKFKSYYYNPNNEYRLFDGLLRNRKLYEGYDKVYAFITEEELIKCYHGLQ